MNLTEPQTNFHMPAEWEPHAATWLAWPHYRGDWPGKFEPIPWVYAEIIRHLARHERVELIVNDAASEKSARKTLNRANASCDNIRFHRWPTNRVWTRDSGCTFVTQPSSARPDSPFDFAQGRLGRLSPRDLRENDVRAVTKKSLSRMNSAAKIFHGHVGTAAQACPERSRRGRPSRAKLDSDPSQLCAIKWRFNAWAKYSNFRHDANIGSLMAKAAQSQEVRPLFGKQHIVLEGGSIDVNGQGTLLTTEECLFSKVQQRNPGMKRGDYEEVFADYLGIKRVIWLGSGIVGDDTHGHVDDLTRFVAPGTVVTAVESNPKDPNYEPLRENLRRLQTATDQNGKPLTVVELPMPSPVVFEKRRLPASYANFYIANGIVLVPVFNDPNDRFALDILGDVFPDREVIGIYSGDLIWGFGAIHCMTQQQPA